MTVIYTMTFGSFIGYSAAFPLAIKVIFGFSHIAGPDGVLTHDTLNANAPSALMFAWMGPFIGALIRPVGGWISDKVGGAKVTQVVSIVMIASALGVAYFMAAAYKSATPEEFFLAVFSSCSSYCLRQRVLVTGRHSGPSRSFSTRSRRDRSSGGLRPSPLTAHLLFPKYSASKLALPRLSMRCMALQPSTVSVSCSTGGSICGRMPM